LPTITFTEIEKGEWDLEDPILLKDLCYRCPNSDNFAADGTVYFPITEIDIELYTDKKDPKIEKKLEDLLVKSGIFFDKTETWIESEKLYEVLYSFEQEA
jgi:hypothetical protein